MAQVTKALVLGEAASASTRTATMAALLSRAAEMHASATALRWKRSGEWRSITYAETWRMTCELGLGLVDAGVVPGDRVCILAGTRPEWTLCDLALASIRAVVVPIYPTSSAEECAWIVRNSGAVAVICEDIAQLEKLRHVSDTWRGLRTVAVMEPDPAPEHILTLDALRQRGVAGDREKLVRDIAESEPNDPYTLIYTSGTTGLPKGCVITHENYRAAIDMCLSLEMFEPAASAYLYLPLAHAFARLIQLLALDVGASIAYWSGKTELIVQELQETRPTHFPSVPRVFEKIYTLATGAVAVASESDRRGFLSAIEVGAEVRERRLRGEPVPADMQKVMDAAEGRLYRPVRELFGGRLSMAITASAPISPEILRFFWACGVPVLEAFGMTETSTVATISTFQRHRFGTVGRPAPGCEVRIADDGEILVRGPNVFTGYYKDDGATAAALVDGWLHTGDLGSLDDGGYLSISGRKKDIIITAGGHNVAPATIENAMMQSRWVSNVLVYGDRRPYLVMLVTLDESEILPWARQQGLSADLTALANSQQVRALIESELRSANANVASHAQVKRFTILDRDFTEDAGELTPTLKVRRRMVSERYASVLDDLYDERVVA